MSTMSQLRELRNYVNGEFASAREGATLEVVDPSTGQAYATSPLSGPADVDDAMKAARTAFEEVWRDTTPSERMGYLLKMAEAIESNAERLVGIEAENTGKPKGLTLSEEIPPMCDQIRFFAGAARSLEGRATAEYMRGCHIPLVAEMPHGGFKQSGYGKDLSAYSFEEYTRVKHVMSSIDD